ncbi:MAG TPA: hypothetical protein DDW81_02780 [Cryomorphaceae bacterium]|nr:hypothetical protein [Owenweeksia sp.]HBF18992.1 hypothetical protein [Cryomorphaceae bacterium]|tara:strand:+ start:604 stop:984 length:381 start_codon:yes stop_codon:yes gene_type:complete
MKSDYTSTMSGFQLNVCYTHGIRYLQVWEICYIHHPKGEEMARKLFKAIINTFIESKIDSSTPEIKKRDARKLIISDFRAIGEEWEKIIFTAAIELKHSGTWTSGGLFKTFKSGGQVEFTNCDTIT